MKLNEKKINDFFKKIINEKKKSVFQTYCFLKNRRDSNF